MSFAVTKLGSTKSTIAGTRTRVSPVAGAYSTITPFDHESKIPICFVLPVVTKSYLGFWASPFLAETSFELPAVSGDGERATRGRQDGRADPYGKSFTGE